MAVARARWSLVAAAVATAMLFASSVWLGRWWSVGEVTIGPLGSHNCFAGECRGGGLSWIGGTDLWMRSGIATGAAGLIAMVLLLGMAGGFAVARTPKLLAKMMVSTLVAAIACGAYFVAKFPGVDGASLSLGFYLFAAGLVAAAGIVTFCMLDSRPARS